MRTIHNLILAHVRNPSSTVSTLKTKAESPLMALTRPPAATRLSLLPTIAWIFRKTRSFPPPAHAGFGFLLQLEKNCAILAIYCISCQEIKSRKNGLIRTGGGSILDMTKFGGMRRLNPGRGTRIFYGQRDADFGSAVGFCRENPP